MGPNQAYGSSVERGERNVTIGTADRIAMAPGTALAGLFAGLERISYGSSSG